MVASGVRQMGRPAPLRLTRRGRVVVLAFFVLLASLAGALLLATASRASGPEASPPRTVVVGPRDTLWSIASRDGGDRGAWDAIVEIQHLNGLDGYLIQPGDTLTLPPQR